MHGNVDPVQNKIDEVFFDWWHPVFREEDPHMNRLLRLSIQTNTPGLVMERSERLSAFVLNVLDCLEPRSRSKSTSWRDSQAPVRPTTASSAPNRCLLPTRDLRTPGGRRTPDLLLLHRPQLGRPGLSMDCPGCDREARA